MYKISEDTTLLDIYKYLSFQSSVMASDEK